MLSRALLVVAPWCRPLLLVNDCFAGLPLLLLVKQKQPMKLKLVMKKMQLLELM